MASKKKSLDKLMVQVPPERSAVHDLLKERSENYAMNMYQLQSMAHLTFIEAKAFLELYYDYHVAQKNHTVLMDYDPDGPRKERLNNSSRRRAKKKIEASGHTVEEIFGDYYPKKEYAPLYF